MMEMQRLSETKAKTLFWIQPKLGKPIYELRCENELFGILRWLTHIGIDPALFVSADGEWKLTTDWWGWPHAVHITNSDGDVALCRQNPTLSLTRAFSVEFVNGHKFRWRTNFWVTRSVFSGE
jgi:hypothetical protein